MRSSIICMLFLFTLPYSCLCQEGFPRHKTLVVGGSKFSINEQGVSFGKTDPVFLAPADTSGNVLFTGIIRGVRVIGRFAPCAYATDTTYAEDPSNGEMYMVCHPVYSLKKQGEWDYFYGKGFCYHEFYDKGALTDADSWKQLFSNKRKGITVADSMGKIRSYVDQYVKKGDGSAPRRESAIE